MRKIFYSACTALAALAGITSCSKDEVKAVLKGDPGAAVLTVPSSTIAVDSMVEADSAAYNFTWTKADYGAQVATIYTLQIAKNQNELGLENDSAIVAVLPGITNYKLTNGVVRSLGNAAGIAEGAEGTFYARVISAINGAPSIQPLKSDVKSFKISYYNTPLAKLWVPGDYQGWDPAIAPFLTGINGSGKFSGTIEKTKVDGTLSDGGFKFTTEPSFTSGIAYGVDTDPKKINATGGNLNLPDGTYFFTVNTNNLSWTYEARNWALAGTVVEPMDNDGSGTPDGWEVDANMRWNNEEQVYEITRDLFAGAYKFRENDGWAVNLGGPGASDPLEDGGPDITLADPGNYTIKLNVAAKTFTITKN
jgi:starch-binding outer membrane protein SusE/F